MFTVRVGLVFRSKYMQIPFICSLQYSININTVEVDPHSDLLHICIVKPKNIRHGGTRGARGDFTKLSFENEAQYKNHDLLQ